MPVHRMYENSRKSRYPLQYNSLLPAAVWRNHKTNQSEGFPFDDANLSINTVTDYIGAFNRLFLLRDTPPFSTFLRSPARVKQMSKRRFCDPSLAAALLQATPKMMLRDLRTFGLLFESLVMRDLEIYAEAMEGTSVMIKMNYIRRLLIKQKIHSIVILKIRNI